MKTKQNKTKQQNKIKKKKKKRETKKKQQIRKTKMTIIKQIPMPSLPLQPKRTCFFFFFFLEGVFTWQKMVQIFGNRMSSLRGWN